MTFFDALITIAMTFTPAQMKAVVRHEAIQQHVPVKLAVAVAKVESNFDPHMVGGVGEIGLMQVRPETAEWMGFHAPLPVLYVPEVNAHFGVKYLSLALERAHGNHCAAASYYNAGLGAHHTGGSYCHAVMAAEKAMTPHLKQRRHRK